MTTWSPWDETSGDDWMPMPAEDFSAELAQSHPHYGVERLLGHGGMGAVYAARDRKRNQPIAIKMLRPDALADESYVRRFDHEIASLRRLQHANVVRILDAGTTVDGYRFLVMELLEGETLAHTIAGPARMSLQKVVRVMNDVCAGVQHIHEQGLVHRDLKAANVFLLEQDGHAVVLDFGVARAATTPQSTMSRLHGPPGTHGHIAPEVRQGRAATPASDVFSLGVVFLQMLIGELPDVGHHLPSDVGLDSRLDAVAKKAINHVPADRYRSVADFVDAINTATLPPRKRDGSGQDSSGIPTGHLTVAAAVAQDSASTRDVRFIDSSAVERHRQFFRAHSSEGLSAARPAASAKAQETWKVQHEWDASHSVPKRGDGQRINPPALVAFSPLGDRLITSCDAWGLSVWCSRTGRLLGRDARPTSYGYPVRFFIAQPHRDSCCVLQETQSFRNHYYLLHDGDAGMIGEGWNEALWGWMSMPHSPPSPLNFAMGLNPWRPGSLYELAVVEGDSVLKIVHINSIDRAAEQVLRGVANTNITLLDQLINLFVQRRRLGPAAHAEKRSPLHDARAESTIRFDTLGARDKRIRWLHWHPSGEYIAVETGAWEDDAICRVHVVHVRSAEVVASIPAIASALGWSPGGRFLLVKRWPESSVRVAAAEVIAWDSISFDVRSDIEPLLDHPWALRCLHDAPDSPGARRHPSGATTLSADGQRMLGNNATTVVKAVRDGVSVRAGEVVAHVSQHSFAHGAWSPTDPYCFVTVGGAGSDALPDTYDFCDKPHGRLLRLWRMAD